MTDSAVFHDSVTGAYRDATGALTIGGGSGVPDPSAEPDGKWLRTLSGAAVWQTATTANLPDSTNKRYVTDAELVVIGNTSGTNTGDQTSVSGNAATATALQTARAIDGQNFDGTANITVIAPGTHAATSKATPVDADELPLADSAALFVLKKLSWANVKATLKTYFDTLYPSGSGTSTGTNTGDQTVPGLATPALALGSAAAAGAASTTIRSDGTIAAFDTTVPSTQAFADAAAIGTAAFAARRDHKHAMMADPFAGTTAAAAIGGVFWTVVTKGTDESVSGSTTLQADDELLFTPASGGLYEIELVVVYASPAGASTPDIRVEFAEDATSRGTFIAYGFGASDAAQVPAFLANTSTIVTFGTQAANRLVLMRGSYAGTGNPAGLWWAQNTSGANATIVRAGSLIRYRRIL